MAEESGGLIGSRLRNGRTRPAANGERGAAAVELALVLFPLLLILLGIVEFGRVYSTQLRLQHAAREVAREAALRYDDSGVTNLGDLLNDTLDDLVGDLGVLEQADITECSTAAPVDRAEVYLEDRVVLVLPVPDTIRSVPISANAVMTCEG